MQAAWIMDEAVAAWEGEGGSRPGAGRLTGTVNQVELAEELRAKVGAEFDRVANAFSAVALKQSEPARRETQAVIAILSEKRAEVMADNRAGYFISKWQNLDGRVRQILAADPRYQVLKAKRPSNKNVALRLKA